jgi:hypothetical protein
LALTLFSATLVQQSPTAERGIPLYPGIGTYRRDVTTSVPLAKRFFDQGLAFLYGFHYDHAGASFQHAIRLDPKPAIFYWGAAMAKGPNWNFNEVSADENRAALEFLTRAERHLEAATPVERALIEAAKTRFSVEESADRSQLDQAYAEAMGAVARDFPTDLDVRAMAAEARILTRARANRNPDGSLLPEALANRFELESVLQTRPDHPLANHLLVHLAHRTKPDPDARLAANRLRGVYPDVPHLEHMPSHIDIHVGEWDASIAANDAAIRSETRLRRNPPVVGEELDFHAYHQRDFLIFSLLMTAQRARAESTVESLAALVPPGEMNAFVEEQLNLMRLGVFVRFGQWNRILAMPALEENSATWLAYRGVAQTATGDLEGAAKSLAEMDAIIQRLAGNVADLVGVQRSHLAGELALAQGKGDVAIRELEEAVRREDTIRSFDPPEHRVMARHALGTALLKLNRAEEAEKVFREDLMRWPRNAWGLAGLRNALQAQSKSIAEIEPDLERAQKRADIPLVSACLCAGGG